MVEILQLRYRDLVVVDPTLPVPVASVIFIRPKALVVNLDVGGSFRMIICENQCFILGLPGMTDTAITTLPTLDHPFVVSLSECLRRASQNVFEDAIGMPYELIVLETALNAAVGILTRDIEDFETKAIDQIEAMLKRVDRDTLEGIRKVKNHVDWLQSKVSKLQQEINEILEDDYDMMDMYLGRRSLNSGASPLRQPKQDDFGDTECVVNEDTPYHSEDEDSKQPGKIEGGRKKPRALKGMMMLGPRVPRRSRKAANRRNRTRIYFDVDSLFKQRRRSIQSFCEKRGCQYVREWDSSITHVVCPDDGIEPKKTFKYLMGILTGKHIVSIDWLEKCDSNNSCMPEAEFSLNPLATTDQSRILKGYKIQIKGPSPAPVEELIKAAGASVAKKMSKDEKFMILVLDQEASADGKEVVKEAWYGKALGAGVPVVTRGWLSDSIIKGRASDVKEFTI
jgi:hypothetical protein